MKRLDSACQIAKLNTVAWDLRPSHATSLAPVDLRQKRCNYIVHVAQLHIACRIGDSNRQIIRNVVAEGCSNRVIVRAAPLPEQVLQAVDPNTGSSLRGKSQQRLLCLRLARSVGIVQFSLDRGTENDLRKTPSFPQELAQLLRQPCIPTLEVNRILRPVDAGKMEDHIGLKQGIPKVFGRILATKNRGFAILAFKQMGRKIAAQEPSSPGNENPLHAGTALPFSASCTHCSFSSRFIIPSTSSSSVLWEL